MPARNPRNGGDRGRSCYRRYGGDWSNLIDVLRDRCRGGLIATPGQLTLDASQQHLGITARRGLGIAIGLCLQSAAGGSQVVVRTSPIECERFPVIGVRHVRRPRVAITNPAEEFRRLLVLILIQRATRRAIHRIRDVRLRAGLVLRPTGLGLVLHVKSEIANVRERGQAGQIGEPGEVSETGELLESAGHGYWGGAEGEYRRLERLSRHRQYGSLRAQHREVGRRHRQPGGCCLELCRRGRKRRDSDGMRATMCARCWRRRRGRRRLHSRNGEQEGQGSQHQSAPSVRTGTGPAGIAERSLGNTFDWFMPCVMRSRS